MKPRDIFIIETFLLSRVKPDQWDKFLAAFRNYTSEFTREAVKAPPDQIQMSAGRAQQMITITEDLMNIDELYKKIKHYEQA